MNSKSAGYNSLTLAAGDSIEIPAHAEFLRCLEADGNFEFNIEDGGWQYMAAGISYISDSPQGFETFRLRNKGVGSVSLVIAYGWGELRDDRISLVGDVLPVEFASPQKVEQHGNFAVEPIEFASPQEVRMPSPNVFATQNSETIAAMTVVELSAARVGQKRLIVTNIGSDTVWLKSSGTTGESGVPARAGEKVVLETSAQVFVYNGNNFSVKVAIGKEYWS